MKKENICLVCWLVLSLLLCFIMHYFSQLALGRYQFADETDFKRKQFNGALEYKEFLASNYVRGRKTGTVNPVFAKNLPADLHQLALQDKTEIFISLILPAALQVNDLVQEERADLLQLMIKQKKFHRLTAKERWQLNLLYKKYRLVRCNVDELLPKVDIIPPSLILAQAITESGWGTSRFARDGNGLYGLHVSANSKAKYMLSRQGNVKVAVFDSVLAATREYVENLNSHRAYRMLREIRLAARKNQKKPDGEKMAKGLLRYSEIGERYIRDLLYLINRYDLKKYDEAHLNDRERGLIVQFAR